MNRHRPPQISKLLHEGQGSETSKEFLIEFGVLDLMSPTKENSNSGDIGQTEILPSGFIAKESIPAPHRILLGKSKRIDFITGIKGTIPIKSPFCIFSNHQRTNLLIPGLYDLVTQVSKSFQRV
jgi:hypothetical protein